MINNPSALCFGEILFDVFGDDRCIGGAPFNFAAHFAQLGGEAVTALRHFRRFCVHGARRTHRDGSGDAERRQSVV